MEPIDIGRLGTLASHDPRRVWRNEATEFTPWLASHIGELNKAIGVEIELAGREVRVGPFAVDLFGREIQTGHAAIIENQLEQTDHSHLGQILTYASGLKAGVIIWIARTFRDEHREALIWLNEISPETVNFFGVELEILEIQGNFAPNFKLVAQPNSWQKAGAAVAGAGASGVSERNIRYQQFFAELLEEAKARCPTLTAASKTQPVSWFWFASQAISGVNFSWAFVTGDRFRVELSIDTPDRERNGAILDRLMEEQQAIEEAIGNAVTSDVAERRRQHRLEVYAPFSATIDSPREALGQLKEWAIGTMIALVQYLRPRLKGLDVEGSPTRVRPS